MAVYPERVELRAFAPRYPTTSDGEAVCGRSASFVCGCYVSFSLRTEKDVIAASFASNGCGYMVAAANVLAEEVSAKPVSDLHGLNRKSLLGDVEREIGVLPLDREHCAEVCCEALRTSFAELRSKRIEEFRGEEALICTCFGVSETVIEQFISQNPTSSVEMVADSCRAGSGCGSCRMLIQEMIDAAETS